jgi:plastocyanin
MTPFLHIVKHVYGISVIVIFFAAFGIFTLSRLVSDNQDIRSNAQTPTTIDVLFDGESFTPSTLTITEGDTVLWTNNHPTEYLQVSSDPHPGHNIYLPLNLDLIAPGDSAGRMFNDEGTFTYHDHLHAQAIGTIIVQAQLEPTSTLIPTFLPTGTPTTIADATQTPTSIPAIGGQNQTATPTKEPTSTITQTPFQNNEEQSLQTVILEHTDQTHTPMPIDSETTEPKNTFSILPYFLSALGITFVILALMYYFHRKQAIPMITQKAESSTKESV